MVLPSKVGVAMLADACGYSRLKQFAQRMLKRGPTPSQSTTEILSPLSLDSKKALLDALIEDLHAHSVDRLYHNSVRRITDANNLQMPGDVIDTSRGPCIVIDLAGKAIGPFETAAMANLARTCVLNPHLVVPGTDSDFIDLCIHHNPRGPHPFTISNGAVDLCVADDAPQAVWRRDQLACALSRIHLGYFSEEDDRLRVMRDYMRNPAQLRSRGMVSIEAMNSAQVWTGYRWRALPLGERWVHLFRAACADPMELTHGVSFSRTSSGLLRAEWGGERLVQLDDGEDARRLIDEALDSVSAIVREVVENGGIEGPAIPQSPPETVQAPAGAVFTPPGQQNPAPASLAMLLRHAVDPSIRVEDRETAIFAVTDLIHSLENRISALEEGSKPSKPGFLPETEGQSPDQGRRRAIRA